MTLDELTGLSEAYRLIAEADLIEELATLDPAYGTTVTGLAARQREEGLRAWVRAVQLRTRLRVARCLWPGWATGENPVPPPDTPGHAAA